MNQQSIIEMTAKKHVKIYLLSKSGLKNSEIAKLLGTNPGHVYNVLKYYKENPEKSSVANNMTS